MTTTQNEVDELREQWAESQGLGHIKTPNQKPDRRLHLLHKYDAKKC